jgi:hypothetical protein
LTTSDSVNNAIDDNYDKSITTATADNIESIDVTAEEESLDTFGSASITKLPERAIVGVLLVEIFLGPINDIGFPKEIRDRQWKRLKRMQRRLQQSQSVN